MRVDAGLVIGAIDAGNVVESIVLGNRSTDEPAMEDIRAADRCAVRLHRRIRLPTADRPGLVEQIRIARDIVVAGLAAISVGVNREIASAGIEQDAAVDASIHRTDCRSRFNRRAARRLHVRERRFGRQSIALERCRRA